MAAVEQNALKPLRRSEAESSRSFTIRPAISWRSSRLHLCSVNWTRRLSCASAALFRAVTLYHSSDRDGQALKLGIVGHDHDSAVHPC